MSVELPDPSPTMGPCIDCGDWDYQNDEGQCAGCSCYDPDEDDKLHGCLGCLVDTADHNCGFKPVVIPANWKDGA